MALSICTVPWGFITNLLPIYRDDSDKGGYGSLVMMKSHQVPEPLITIHVALTERRKGRGCCLGVTSCEVTVKCVCTHCLLKERTAQQERRFEGCSHAMMLFSPKSILLVDAQN